MKKILLLTVVVLCTASLAFGATVCGKVGWYETTAAVDCDLDGTGPALDYVLIHHSFNEVEGVNIKLSSPVEDGCVTCLYGTGSFDFTMAPGIQQGDPLVEIGFAYQACLSGSVQLAGWACFLGSGPTECCEMGVYPGDLQGFLCRPCGAASYYWNLGVISFINGNVGCPCEEPVAVEESTWGGIKALYGEE